MGRGAILPGSHACSPGPGCRLESPPCLAPPRVPGAAVPSALRWFLAAHQLLPSPLSPTSMPVSSVIHLFSALTLGTAFTLREDVSISQWQMLRESGGLDLCGQCSPRSCREVVPPCASHVPSWGCLWRGLSVSPAPRCRRQQDGSRLASVGVRGALSFGMAASASAVSQGTLPWLLLVLQGEACAAGWVSTRGLKQRHQPTGRPGVGKMSVSVNQHGWGMMSPGMSPVVAD